VKRSNKIIAAAATAALGGLGFAVGAQSTSGSGTATALTSYDPFRAAPIVSSPSDLVVVTEVSLAAARPPYRPPARSPYRPPPPPPF